MDWTSVKPSDRQQEILDRMNIEEPHRTISSIKRDLWCAAMWTLIYRDKDYDAVIESMRRDAPTLGRSAKWQNACGWFSREWNHTNGTSRASDDDYKQWLCVQSMIWFSQNT
jgi:hypothetical protein